MSARRSREWDVVSLNLGSRCRSRASMTLKVSRLDLTAGWPTLGRR